MAGTMLERPRRQLRAGAVRAISSSDCPDVVLIGRRYHERVDWNLIRFLLIGFGFKPRSRWIVVSRDAIERGVDKGLETRNPLRGVVWPGGALAGSQPPYGDAARR